MYGAKAALLYLYLFEGSLWSFILYLYTFRYPRLYYRCYVHTQSEKTAARAATHNILYAST